LQYFWGNTSDVVDLNAARGDQTRINDYVGGPLQESVSALSQCPDTGFTGTQQKYIRYGMEYSPDWDANGKGEVTWVRVGVERQRCALLTRLRSMSTASAPGPSRAQPSARCRSSTSASAPCRRSR
jgi:hypothetical protein